MHTLTATLALMALLTLVGCADKQPPQPQRSPPEVDVALPLQQNITEWDEFTGRFEAVERVEIRARVTGYLVKKAFRDGQRVNRGDVLFVIDQRPFQYVMQRAQAQFTLAEKTYNRAKGLRASNSISQELYDQRTQEYQSALAAVNEAKLNLEFTEVKAPIDGRISDAFVDTGNLVRANETELSRIVSIDPIHFEFEGSQADLLKYLRLDRAGKRPSSVTAHNPIVIKLLDEDSFVHAGYMDFVDNVIDEGTGTVKGRAMVENKDGIIFPGLFGRARLIGRDSYQAILLPEKAINTDQSRKYVYAVTDDNTVQRVYITPGPILDNGFVVIRDGLRGNERVVVNGIQRVRAPNQPVAPLETPLKWTPIETMPIDIAAETATAE